eukprot:GFUD01111449.1.p1 GENE.GFUD01111449.1~~GFUD01111449.1.p1  ORF type:complete len:497 (+),score=182.27 GFUD01111449.1:38-1528(+)
MVKCKTAWTWFLLLESVFSAITLNTPSRNSEIFKKFVAGGSLKGNGSDKGEDFSDIAEGEEERGECQLYQTLQGAFRKRLLRMNSTITNKLWSKLSAYMALSILYQGTAGDSREQLGSLLGRKDQDKQDQVDRQLQSWLVRSVCLDCEADKQAQLVLANAVLVKVEQDQIKEEFLKKITEAGRIGKEETINSVYHVKFEHNLAIDKINTWAKEMTGGMISQMLKPGQVDEKTRMIVVNLLYFNGQWKTKFNPKDTFKDVFHTPSGDKEVQLMYKKEKMEYGYDSEKGFSWVEIPYAGDKFTMIAYLPKQDDGLSTALIEAALGNERNEMNQTSCALAVTTNTEVELFFPKFDLENEDDLSAGLKAAGVVDLFKFSKADFSNMMKNSKEKMAITSIIQTTKIQVTEKGTKAAAVTKVIAETNRMGGGEPIRMRFDRPFLFHIVSLPDKFPIFGGRVVDPTPGAQEHQEDAEAVEGDKSVEKEAGQDYSDDSGETGEE